ncbi:MAG: F420-0--gamma-glutamyl ligase [Clostridia bacterium]|jgi:F420-0:gamma-glutamyl ligase|nr:F420-0--gamma-glutamyl ligase [Clostridia bacterium]
MVRTVGTTVRGIRTPIVKKGDDLVRIVVDSILQSAAAEKYQLADRDVIGITESLLARAQGNYATIEDVSWEVKGKFPGDIVVLFPLLSRNRFLPILEGIVKSGKRIYLILQYPADEVGNSLLDVDLMDELGINPCVDVLSEKEYRRLFGERITHPFTGIDYVQMYRDLAKDNRMVIYLSNNPKFALEFAGNILVANVHERKRTKRILEKAGAKGVLGLDDLFTGPVNNSGYNPEYGLLGSNKAGENKIKLFPRDSQSFVEEVQQMIKKKTGKHVEVLVYGDGAFKDPQSKIWELADPVVCPGYTSGLSGTPHEVKLKYIADNELEHLPPAEAARALKKKIREQKENKESLGTTPRHLTDLLGSLCDLTSGSGDKGTPVVLIQGYFDNFATE